MDWLKIRPDKPKPPRPPDPPPSKPPSKKENLIKPTIYFERIENEDAIAIADTDGYNYCRWKEWKFLEILEAGNIFFKYQNDAPKQFIMRTLQDIMRHSNDDGCRIEACKLMMTFEKISNNKKEA